MVRLDNRFERRDEKRIIIRPNASLTRRQASAVFVGISVVSLTIAVYFALLGGWMVLPFSGGELIVFGGCLYHTLRQSSVREVIVITDNRVRIEKGHGDKAEQCYEFNRGWATITVSKPLINGYPSRLFIRSHGKAVEIGRFLVETERKQLAAALKGSLAW